MVQVIKTIHGDRTFDGNSVQDALERFKRADGMIQDHSVFADAKLSGLFARDLRVTGCEFSGVTDLTSSTLIDSRFNTSRFEELIVGAASISNCDFKSVRVKRGDFRRSSISVTSMRNVSFSNCLFDDAALDVNFNGGYIEDSSFENCHLSGSDFRGCLLNRVSFKGANLSGVRFYGATMHHCDFEGARGLSFQIPQEGELIGYKKCHVKNPMTGMYDSIAIVKVRVPPEARRTGVLTSNKCRAEFVEVLDVSNRGIAYSMFDHETKYSVGDVVRPSNGYDPSMEDPCVPGIHFFLTRKEAEEFNF